MDSQPQLYVYGGRIIRSHVDLAELPPAIGGDEANAAPLCEVMLESDCTPPGDWIHQWRDARGQVVAALARMDGGYLLRFPDLADFRVSSSGRQIFMSRPETTSLETLRHLLLDHVLPRVLAHAGAFAIHGSCVRHDNRALVFVGETGQGKSSLAASFDSAGYPLVSDDALILLPHDEGPRILPTYHSLRLWPDAVSSLFARTPPLAPMAHYSSKWRVQIPAGTDIDSRQLPVSAVFVLRSEMPECGSTRVKRLAASDGCVELVRHTFQLDVTDLRRAAMLFSLAGEFASWLPFYLVDYPREFAVLPDVRAAILAHDRLGILD